MIASALWDFFFGLSQSFQVTIIVAMFLSLTVCVAAVSAAWRGARESADRAKMMNEMVKRGLPTEEITRLMLVAQLSNADDSSEELTIEENPEAYVVKALSDNWYESADIKQILRAARDGGELDDSTARAIETLAKSWTETDAIVEAIESRRGKASRADEIGSTDMPGVATT